MDEQPLTGRGGGDPQEVSMQAGDAAVETAEPVRIGSLDVRGARARIEFVDDDVVMFVHDGDSEIEFSSGLGGTWRDAIAGAHEIAAVALMFAEELGRRGPRRCG
ncbi:hypothetical protein ABT369_31785 [Dactylosporangium sp. NPDC000244]|uniref:hypothetical protein n=1 Tax=Dactylosporangium sp. NPDC000244 TaxID=3154365 RepID=UPI00331E12BB